MFIEIYILIYRLIVFKHYCVGQIKVYNIMDIAIDGRSRVVSLKFLVGYLSPMYAPEMTENPPFEADSRTFRQITCILRNPILLCHVYNGPLVFIPIQMNPVYTLSPPCF